jgi:hypothetical protein
LSKDNENIPASFVTSDGPTPASTTQSFSPDQLVTCEKCLRANPPTRAACLYCGAELPVTAATQVSRMPVPKPLENWEQGYNNILQPAAATRTGDTGEPNLTAAADLLQVNADDLSRAFSLKIALPLRRSSTRDEATMVQEQLNRLGIETFIGADVNLEATTGNDLRVRALEFKDNGIDVSERQGSIPVRVAWPDVTCVVVGRLVSQRLEAREKKASREENRLLHSSEFFNDETVLDFYVASSDGSFRIMAKSFDFSCLKEEKALLAEQNMKRLLEIFKTRATNARWDDSYNSVRRFLDGVWPSAKQTHSGGWRRDRPGKLSKETITETTNEAQFHKYSRLVHYVNFTLKPFNQ